jgi:hypothetical protein
MNRISKNLKKIIIMLEPRMKRLMEKIRDEDNTNYFQLSAEEKDVVIKRIASITLTQTIDILNNYTRDELPDIFEISIINLTSLEEQFIEMEMYEQSAMMRDSITILQNDLDELVKPKL